MSNLLRNLFRAIPAGPLHTIRRFQADPVGTQTRLLRTLLQRARNTEWGKWLDFESILRESDLITAYRDRVPLHGFEAFREDIARIRQGGADIIWPGPFTHFAVSSGTVSAGKVLPVSREMLALNRSFSVGVGLNYLVESVDPAFLGGKSLTLPGRIEELPDYPGAFAGEVSGLQAEWAPAFFRYLYQAVPNELAFLPNWEQKLNAIVERTMDMDIRMLVMVPSWALTFFNLLIDRYNRKHSRRVTTVGEIWPNLQIFITGGVALSSYRNLLEAQIGLESLHFVETYGASEGFFAFQSTLDDPSLLLHLDNGVFFEFVRMDTFGSASPRRYSLEEVEPDVRYTFYVTTCSGLWTYHVGDVVWFTHTFPHKLVVAGRTSEMIDRYGEAVFGEEAAEALKRACDATGARVLYYHVAPRYPSLDTLPSHQWLIEFDQEPDDTDRFVDVIDTYLQKINRHYQIRREARAFDRPELVVLPQGAFYEWLKQTRKEVSGQTKVPRMCEERTVADSVLAVVGSKFRSFA